jgi:hypothetical protein
MDCTIYGTLNGSWAYLSGETVTNSQGKSSKSFNGINFMFTYLYYEDSANTRVTNNYGLPHASYIRLRWFLHGQKGPIVALTALQDNFMMSATYTAPNHDRLKISM